MILDFESASSNIIIILLNLTKLCKKCKELNIRINNFHSSQWIMNYKTQSHEVKREVNSVYYVWFMILWNRCYLYSIADARYLTNIYKQHLPHRLFNTIGSIHLLTRRFPRKTVFQTKTHNFWKIMHLM